MVIYGNSFSGGDVTVPPSKSAAHRALLCAALSGGKSVVSPIDPSDDMAATLGAVRALGCAAQYDEKARAAFLDGSQLGRGSGGEIDCLESGSTLRFLIPLAAALGGTWRFTGRGRLPQRPLGVYEKLLPEHGVSFRPPKAGGAQLPLEISGKLLPGIFSLPGNISSQFVTGLLFALPLLEGDSEIVLTSPLESEGYVNLTLSILEDFGVTAQKTERGWRVPGGQRYAARDYTVEGDWSQAAFFLSMAALDPRGQEIRLHGLDPRSIQGDRACVERFQEFGLRTEWRDGVLALWNPRAFEPFGGLRGCVIDASQIPDMVPSLSVCAALCRGETRIIRAERLRLKESDRLAAMEAAIQSLGGQAQAVEDGLVIQGVRALRGGTAEGQNDHRVVMALAAGALRSRGEVRVTDETSIRKTYPSFFEDFSRLGGSARVVDLG